MHIHDMVARIAKCNKEKGWRDKERSALEVHMLCVSELAEATEAVRNREPDYHEVDGKPEGEMMELADAVIRIMDYFDVKGWSLEWALQRKVTFNEGRPYRHGNKTI